MRSTFGRPIATLGVALAALLLAISSAAAHTLAPDQIIGQLRLPAVREAYGVEDVARLDGLPRLLVVRVGRRWSEVPATQRQEIAENLHRSELTALERDTHIGRWAELTAAKVGQVDPPSGGAQPAGGCTRPHGERVQRQREEQGECEPRGDSFQVRRDHANRRGSPDP